MEICNEYNTQPTDRKSLYTGCFIAIELQEYYNNYPEYSNIEQFCDDYVGFKYHKGVLRDKKDYDYYKSQYGEPSTREPYYPPEIYYEYLIRPLSERASNIHFDRTPYTRLQEIRNEFKDMLVADIDKYKECKEFKQDVLKVLWLTSIKWTEKTINFVRNNKDLLYSTFTKGAVKPNTQISNTIRNEVFEPYVPGVDPEYTGEFDFDLDGFIRYMK
jgi:hypothetical protein